LCCTYITPNSSTVINTDNFSFFDEIESGLEKYKLLGKCFILGDLNSRTSNQSEILSYDNYIDQENGLSCNVEIPPRVSKDKLIDSLGRRLIEFCQTTSYIICNGRLHRDANIGESTFCSINGSSVVDYLLIHMNDLNCISDFSVAEPNEFSDHNGLSFNIPCNKVNDNSNQTEQCDTIIKWDENKRESFLNLLRSKRNILNDVNEQICSNENVNIIADKFTEILHECASNVFSVKHKHNNSCKNKLKQP
jgi:hypothetical protein